jgi:hypothetical protein
MVGLKSGKERKILERFSWCIGRCKAEEGQRGELAVGEDEYVVASRGQSITS